MHRCLNIVEVQRAIFLEVLCKREGRATLVGLAHTCRTLSNTALNVLWASLPSIAHLIRSLPLDLWRIENHKMKFRRPMSHGDWKIFLSYASRVRSLSGFGGMGTCVSLDNDVILALSQPLGYGPLLPNLETLDLYLERNDAYTPLLQQLLTSSLVTLRLPGFVFTSPVTLMQLMSRCSSVKRLCFMGPSVINRASPEILSETVMRLDSLQSLECPLLNENAIIHLSRLPSLVELSLSLNHDIDPNIVKSGLASLPQFTALESLTLGTRELPSLTSLLEVMRFKPQSVSFSTQDVPSPDALRLFFITLVNACDRERLTKISLSANSKEWLSSDEREQVSLSTFQPLLVFPNIESFTFDSMSNIFLDDDAMKAVTKHWPKLIAFSLNAFSGWGIESRITILGLIVLLRSPALHEFALSVNLARIDRPQDQIPDMRPGNGFLCRCERAQFVTSTINHPATIAAFLSDICPLLKVVTSSGDEEEGEEEEARTQSWEEVNDLLPAFLAVRKQCWNWRGKMQKKISSCS